MVKLEIFQTYLFKKPNFSFIEKNVALGSRPVNYELYKKYSISAILNLRGEKDDDRNLIEKYKVDYLRIPVKDSFYPSFEDTKKAIEWIDKKVKEDKKVLIHCKSGKGRSPFLACCYLLSKGYNLEEALLLIRSRRKMVLLNSIQLEALNSFLNELKFKEKK